MLGVAKNAAAVSANAPTEMKLSALAAARTMCLCVSFSLTASSKSAMRAGDGNLLVIENGSCVARGGGLWGEGDADHDCCDGRDAITRVGAHLAHRFFCADPHARDPLVAALTDGDVDARGVDRGVADLRADAGERGRERDGRDGRTLH
jgi:hypothetical protein